MKIVVAAVLLAACQGSSKPTAAPPPKPPPIEVKPPVPDAPPPRDVGPDDPPGPGLLETGEAHVWLDSELGEQLPTVTLEIKNTGKTVIAVADPKTSASCLIARYLDIDLKIKRTACRTAGILPDIKLAAGATQRYSISLHDAYGPLPIGTHSIMLGTEHEHVRHGYQITIAKLLATVTVGDKPTFLPDGFSISFHGYRGKSVGPGMKSPLLIDFTFDGKDEGASLDDQRSFFLGGYGFERAGDEQGGSTIALRYYGKLR